MPGASPLPQRLAAVGSTGDPQQMAIHREAYNVVEVDCNLCNVR